MERLSDGSDRLTRELQTKRWCRQISRLAVKKLVVVSAREPIVGAFERQTRHHLKELSEFDLGHHFRGGLRPCFFLYAQMNLRSFWDWDWAKKNEGSIVINCIDFMAHEWNPPTTR